MDPGDRIWKRFLVKLGKMMTGCGGGLRRMKEDTSKKQRGHRGHGKLYE
jgi:hypothetical protein